MKSETPLRPNPLVGLQLVQRLSRCLSSRVVLILSALSATSACGDTPDVLEPVAVLDEYEHAVARYWENTRLSCSASVKTVVVAQTLLLSEKAVGCVSETRYPDNQTPVKNAYSVGRGDLFVTIQGAGEQGTNTKSWRVRSNLNVPDDARLRTVAVFAVRELLGVLSGTTEEEVTTISDQLRKGDRLRASRATVDGVETVALSSDGPAFALEVVLIPSKGYVLRRMEYTNLDPKAGQVRKRISEFRDFFPCREVWLPRVGVRTLHKIPTTASPKSVSDTSFDKIITTKFRVQPLRQLEEGEVAAFAEDILGKIEDGTRVTMQDALDLDFEWRGGKPVPVTAEGATP